MSVHRFHPTILREYDIRGIVGETLGPDDALAIGKAFGTVVRKAGGRRLCVGYDGRLSAPELEAIVVEGLLSTGLEVERIGRGPTPMLYFAVYDRKADAGIMVTGSHNPPEYNGFKMIHTRAPIYGDAIQELGRLCAKADFIIGQGSSITIDVKDAYVARLLDGYEQERPLTVAWDVGNGVVGEVLHRVTERLKGRHYRLFDTVDGRFLNHHPDPTVEANLVDLKQAVLQHRCDLGIGFDGDGDRLGVVDHRGRVIWGDQLLAIYTAEVLKTHPGATIIADVKSSQVVFDEIDRLKGVPMMWKTGHSLLKAKMQETGSPLAGELSGHIFFADKWYGFDDALYCALRLISLVSRCDTSLATLRDRLPTMFNTPEIRVSVSEERKKAIVEEVKNHLVAQGANVIDIDGIRVTTPEGWWLLRVSNTQNMVVLRVEAFTKEGLSKLQESLVTYLAKSGISLSF